MSGNRMEQAKAALVLMIRQLPVDCKFNIVSFGSNHQFLWPAFRDYAQDSIEIAIGYVQRMMANMGGTEILSPLEAIFQIPCNTLRHVMVFTDGSVSNTHQVLELCGLPAVRRCHRVHGVGIGQGCSTGL